MRLGVLTFHRAINFGSYWQARCLVEELAGCGHEVELLDHRSRAIDWKEWRCALAPLPGSAPHRADYRAKTRALMAAADALPRSSAFDSAGPAPAGYDAIVVGSDEVWNLRHPWFGSVPLFFGHGLADRRITYAASLGHYPADAGLPHSAAAALAQFDRLSVRDMNSWRAVGEATGRWPEIVPDPCLAFPHALLNILPHEADPYLLVYGHDFPHWYVEAVTAEAHRRGWRIRAIGYHADFADETHIAISPDGFAAAFAGAAAVATNFFHGLVFSLLYARPVAVGGSDYRHLKLRDLTDRLGIRSRRLETPDDAGRLATLFDEPPNVAGKLAGFRLAARDYLDDAL